MGLVPNAWVVTVMLAGVPSVQPLLLHSVPHSLYVIEVPAGAWVSV